MKASSILITGCAGFIGSTLSNRLIKHGYIVVGIDSLNNAYNPTYKKYNLEKIKSSPHFAFYKEDILNSSKIKTIINKHRPEIVIHLAALTGIRSSLGNADIYKKVNVDGTKNVFTAALKFGAKSFIFSSSSSIYGNKNQIPFHEQQTPDPGSPYAKTKFEAEQLVKQLNKKHHLPTTILRLFSVYGPHGRPDMAPYIFTEAAFSQKPITLYGNGSSARDYTYIDDVMSAIEKAIQKQIGNQTLNIGSSHPIKLTQLISIIEDLTQKKIYFLKKPLINAEAHITYADTTRARNILDWSPKVEFRQGMKQFVKWYKTTRLSP